MLRGEILSKSLLWFAKTEEPPKEENLGEFFWICHSQIFGEARRVLVGGGWADFLGENFGVGRMKCFSLRSVICLSQSILSFFSLRLFA